MKVAILHYHLNRGGVTKVVQNHLLALDAVLRPDEPLEVALVYGGRKIDWPEDFAKRLKSIRLSLCAVPSLDYDDQQPGGLSQPGTLGEPLARALDDLESAPADTVLHVHNHAVGKNAALPEAIWSLAERGYALVLHVHDFVEDFRPANFRRLSQAFGRAPHEAGAGTPGAGSPGAGSSATSWHGRLYPQAPHVRYAVLTSRDRGILEGAGVNPAQLDVLPNPVLPMEGLPPREHARDRLAEKFAVRPDDRFVLYPVRCIRRKNVGEAVLYSRLGPPGTIVGLTLPPLNPVAAPIYARWKEVAAGLEFPCRFDVGGDRGLTFGENLAASDLILTTSVAEGFGMAFLESWLAGRPLIGRDLPEITCDFKEAGLRLDGLRPRLEIPSEWLDVRRVRHTILEAYRLTLAAYGRPQPLSLSDGLDAKLRGTSIDFGDLDEPLQEQVLQRVAKSGRGRGQLLECNPWIERALATRADGQAALIRANAQAINERFSLVPSGQRLLRVYQQAAASPRSGHIAPLEHAARIFDWALDLSRFRLIRCDFEF
jgi:hypothetical protein